MDNHYHLLIETPASNLSRGMRQLNGVYTQSYNRRHRKTGHVFQGRYKAVLVEKESYLLELSRYVVLNPVRAGITEKPEDWKWSSYSATVGIKKTPHYLTVDWILADIFKEKILDKQTRDERIHTAHIKHGYTLKEIADYLGVHYTTVSKAIKGEEVRK